MMMQNDVRRKLSREVADFYEKEGAAFSSKRTKSWNVMSLLSERLKPGDLFVDVGAGNGRLADVLPSDVNYLGIEPSGALRDEARGKKMIAGELPKLELKDDSADVVACIAVLHHIPSKELRDESIAELHRILKPGGTMLITVWNLRAKRFWSWSNFVHAWLRFVGVKGGEPGDLYYVWKASGTLENRYVHAFTLNEFRKIFKAEQWKIENIGAYDRDGWCHWFKGRNLVAIVTRK
ncbi:MAG: class I SAM-dependent methyltransferase [Patescibacteria group bacterium]|nr:class I SAM-dependent methyltransferase [Patescibacteria group bacterium]